MSKNQAPALFMVAILLLATANPSAHAQLNSVLDAVQVTGFLCCSPNGSCSGGAPPLPGVVVGISCDAGMGSGSGNLTVLGNAITNLNGGFTLNLTDVSGLLMNVNSTLLNGKLPCNVTVNLPVSQVTCPTLNLARGLLLGLPTLLSTLFLPVFGLFGFASVSTFVNVA